MEPMPEDLIKRIRTALMLTASNARLLLNVAVPEDLEQSVEDEIRTLDSTATAAFLELDAWLASQGIDLMGEW